MVILSWTLLVYHAKNCWARRRLLPSDLSLVLQNRTCCKVARSFEPDNSRREKAGCVLKYKLFLPTGGVKPRHARDIIMCRVCVWSVEQWARSAASHLQAGQRLNALRTAQRLPYNHSLRKPPQTTNMDTWLTAFVNRRTHMYGVQETSNLVRSNF